MTTQLSVTPRRLGEPEVDHTALRLLHRAMLTATVRFTVLLTNLARAGTPTEARRAGAIRDYLAFGAELHEHHSSEDDIAWPARHACPATRRLVSDRRSRA